MSNVLILACRGGDGPALRDLLVEDGHKVDLADDVRGGAMLGVRPDVIVADREPWTWEGKALIERSFPALAEARLVLLCARIPKSTPPPGVRYLLKPIAFEELRAAIAGGAGGRGSEAA
jgi:hypothetical protein